MKRIRQSRARGQRMDGFDFFLSFYGLLLGFSIATGIGRPGAHDRIAAAGENSAATCSALI
jgi:hypothetical protein